jgi:hypothetical protein
LHLLAENGGKYAEIPAQGVFYTFGKKYVIFAFLSSEKSLKA